VEIRVIYKYRAPGEAPGDETTVESKSIDLTEDGADTLVTNHEVHRAVADDKLHLLGAPFEIWVGLVVS
jgi:hypothetical protein